MKSLFNLQSWLVPMLFVAGTILVLPTASATEHCPPAYSYKTVVQYETIRQPVVEWVTRYDHCGHPIREKVVSYKLVRVAVEKRIKVWH